VSSHSFTPVLDNHVRTADVGILYDPRRTGERALAVSWKSAFVTAAPELRVRRNYPYEGKNDGLTASLRRRHPAERYVGIELELNQALVKGDTHEWRRARNAIVDTLKMVLR
jgi:predicted N-formylglutamate amidohydrolase